MSKLTKKQNDIINKLNFEGYKMFVFEKDIRCVPAIPAKVKIVDASGLIKAYPYKTFESLDRKGVLLPAEHISAVCRRFTCVPF